MPSAKRDPHGDGPDDTRPFICIPYWTKPIPAGAKWDTGELRPLPVVSYACESIHPSDYHPGKRLDVTVDVRNSGGGNTQSLINVVVYWANPTVGFANPNFFAACTVPAIPDRGTPHVATTAVLSNAIPANAPDHICLLVLAYHRGDMPTSTCDPINDRHWAQRNLQVVEPAKNGVTILSFNAANPFSKAMTFQLAAAPANERNAKLVSESIGSQSFLTKPQLKLIDVERNEISTSDEQAVAVLKLRPFEQKSFALEVDLAEPIPRSHTGVLEVTLSSNVRGAKMLVGSLGFALTPGARA